MVRKTEGRRRSRAHDGVIVVALSILLLGAATASAQIRWRSGPAALSGKSRAEVVRTLTAAGLRGESRHVVVQFDQPMTPATRAELRDAGVKLLNYLGDNAFFAVVSSGAVDAAALARVPALLDAQEIQPRWKMHPAFVAGEVPTWARVPAPAGGNADGESWTAAYVLFHPDVDLDAQGRAVVQQYGGQIRSELRSINGLVIHLPASLVPALAADDAVEWIEPPLPPMDVVNDSNRVLTEADEAQAAPYNLDGSGVTVLVYDGGTARSTHQDFGGRVHVRDGSGENYHSTHVAGTIGGSGAASGGTYKGMAPGVIMESYGFEGDVTAGFLYTDPGDLEADYDEAINTYGADVSNNSIGSNTAPNGFPCDWEGNYGATANLIDTIVRGDAGNPLFTAPFRILWANGNERGSGRCGTTYHTTAPPSCAKNSITVGAVNSNDDSVTSFTSWGPTDDDRLKPDISAPGCQSDGDAGVTSTDSASDTAYATLCGTSMATPTACGLSSLLLQDYRAQFPSQPDFRNSTLKALLAHNAVDLQNTGPDYQTGYGSVRIRQTIDFMRTGSFLEAQVDQDGIYSVLVSVDAGDTEVKVTLAWDDVPGTPNVMPVLVNDLDLRVFDPSSVQHYPWTLGGLADPSAPAVRTQADHVNNIEQVVIDTPVPGVYRLEVYGFNVPQGPQTFSLCASPQLVACSSQGVIGLDKPLYACESTAAVSVMDCDLNTDSGTVETVTVTVASDTEPGGETVLLTETGPETADFRGTVPLSETDAAGVLHVSLGDTITATYIDADDGMGGTNVVVTTTAGTDCQAPIISNVQVSGIGSETATVTFDTDESSVGTVRYGTDCAALTQSAVESGSATSHAVLLTGLSDGTRYYFAVDAADEQGNVGTDDNGGSCYSFSTPQVVFDFPMDSDPGWTTAGDWAFGVPAGGGSYAGDPTSGYTGSNVYGYNLSGDYTDNLAATYLTTTVLDCTGLTNVILKFRRWLGVESNSNFDEATIEVSNDGSNWIVIWRATDLGVDVSDSSWQLVEYDISAYADNQPTVYVRWGMGPTDGGLTYPGWNLDDVQIVASGGPLSISYPNGLPDLFSPSAATVIDVRITEGDESYVPGSGLGHYRYDGGTFLTVPLVPQGGELYQATFPAPACGQTPEYYFTAEGTSSGEISDPPTAPSSLYSAGVGETMTLLDDSFESDQGWTVGAPDDDATTGFWDRGNPEGTEAQPENDHTPDPGALCFATDTRAGSSLGTYDVDGGKTTLLSPAFDASTGDVTVGYWVWYSNTTGSNPNTDTFRVDLSNNGGSTWTNVLTLGESFGGEHSGGWFYYEFVVGDFLTGTSAMQLRFVAEDDASDGAGSLVEAAVDDVFISRFECVAGASCSDGVQNQGEDLIDCGGPCPPCACLTDPDCDDGSFCTGNESCDGFGECVSGSFPCAGSEWCDETGDACVPHGDGDFDDDGDVDLADFADFQVCFGEPAGLGCEPGNLTGTDAMIDLQDFAAFESVLTGP